MLTTTEWRKTLFLFFFKAFQPEHELTPTQIQAHKKFGAFSITHTLYTNALGHHYCTAGRKWSEKTKKKQKKGKGFSPAIIIESFFQKNFASRENKVIFQRTMEETMFCLRRPYSSVLQSVEHFSYNLMRFPYNETSRHSPGYKKHVRQINSVVFILFGICKSFGQLLLQPKMIKK